MEYNDPEKYDKRYLLNEIERYFHDRWHPTIILKIKKLCKEKIVMDLGCGTCEFTKNMDDAKLVIGLDISIHMLRYGQSKINPRKTYLIKGDASKIPIKSNKCELICCIGLIPYIHMTNLFKECNRILKNEGKIMIVFPNKWSFYNLQFKLFNRIFSYSQKSISSRKEYSYFEVKKLLKSFGFTVNEVNSFGMVIYVPLYLQKYAKYLWILMDKFYSSLQRKFPFGLSVMIIADKSNRGERSI